MVVLKKNTSVQPIRLAGKVVKTKRKTVYIEAESNVIYIMPMSQVLEKLFSNQYA